MFDPATSPPIPSAISSQESGSGHTPCASLGGLTIVEFGQAVAPANLSARQAKALGLMMSGTCGPRGSNSLRSASLTASMVSRLRARTASLGSTLFTLTWKQRATPAGLSISALRASALRTSGNDCGSWRSPNTVDAQLGTRKGPGQVQLCHQAVLAAPWPTTTRMDAQSAARHGYMIEGNPGTTLLDAARLAAPWTTTTTRDWKDTGALKPRVEGKTGVHAERADQLGRQAQLASGPSATGSPVETAKRGQLSPGLSRWLMALPPVWCACALTAMRSLPKRRPK